MGFDTVFSMVPGVIIAFIALFIPLAISITRFYFALPELQKGVIGFFHPAADGGGGGERVLWCAIKAISKQMPHAQIVIYCRHGVTVDALRANAKQYFNVDVPDYIKVVPLHSAVNLDPSRYHRFTLFNQAFASIQVVAEAVGKIRPQVWVDTTGWAFPYPMLAAFKVKVVAYVHYPTISSDMEKRVANKTSMYNNSSQVAGSSSATGAKLIYYKLLKLAYSYCGSRANVVMVNSSWTLNHIKQLWKPAATVVYPPVDTSDLSSLQIWKDTKTPHIVCVSQFRPEKNHSLLIDAFALAKETASPTSSIHRATFHLLGGVRNEADADIVQGLIDQVKAKQLQDSVHLQMNATYSQIKEILGKSIVGLHAMVDEHFGICIVEYMAAGVVPIAHRSGGPLMDIVKPAGIEAQGSVGVLADGVEEYAQCISQVLQQSEAQVQLMATTARKSVAKFSQNDFGDQFVQQLRKAM